MVHCVGFLGVTIIMARYLKVICLLRQVLFQQEVSVLRCEIYEPSFVFKDFFFFPICFL